MYTVFNRLAITPLIHGLILLMFVQNAQAKDTPIQQTLKNAATKISESEHPAVKLALGSVSRMGKTYFTALGLIVAKEALKRLSDDNLDLNQENVDKKVAEIQHEWGIGEQVAFKTADGLGLFLPIVAGTEGIGFLAGKAIPMLKLNGGFLSKIFPTFVAATAVSLGNNFIDETIRLAALDVIEHPLKFGGVSDSEMKQLTLLQERVGPSYFYWGLEHGGVITHRAYEKVFTALTYFLHDNSLQSLIWGRVWRETALSGNTLTSLIGTTIGGVSLNKFIAKDRTWSGPKKIIIGVGVATFFGNMVSDKWNDKITELTREAWGKLYETRLDRTELYGAKSHQELLFILKAAQEKREKLSNTLLSVSKLSVDKIEALVTEQRKIVSRLEQVTANGILNTVSNSRLLLLQSPELKNRLESRKTENQNAAAFYQSMITKSLNSLIANYGEDAQTLDAVLASAWLTEVDRGALSYHLARISRIQKKLTTLQAIILREYNPKDLINPYASSEYGMARLELDAISLWGLSEDKWITE